VWISIFEQVSPAKSRRWFRLGLVPRPAQPAGRWDGRLAAGPLVSTRARSSPGSTGGATGRRRVLGFDSGSFLARLNRRWRSRGPWFRLGLVPRPAQPAVAESGSLVSTRARSSPGSTGGGSLVSTRARSLPGSTGGGDRTAAGPLVSTRARSSPGSTGRGSLVSTRARSSPGSTGGGDRTAAVSWFRIGLVPRPAQPAATGVLGFDSGSFLARLNRRVAVRAVLHRRWLQRGVSYALAGASRKSRGPPMGWVISHVLAGARLVLFLRSQTPTVTESSRGSLRTGKKQL
jgi:hypothetical protein